MEKVYDHNKYEKKIYKKWNDGGYFKPRSDKNPDFKGESFTIPIPPPNVTGKLHVGHAYMVAVEDLIIRYKRMTGFNTLWLPGTDHAGIATQNVVEKKLAEKGKKKEDLGRKKFIEEVWKWKDVYHENITSQIKAIGASVDWSRERFTLDKGLNESVNHAFVKLYNKGLIYRGEYIVNWCPRCHTVLADDEVEHEETKGNLWYFKYQLKDENGYVTVATTRPETMLGDTAVAVNPKDKKYKNLIGKKLLLPIVNREIEIISDDHVDPKFGTGAVKITPSHDPNDYQMALRHKLAFVKVIGDDGRMTKEAGSYEGVDRYEAREAIVEELDKLNLLERTDPHSHAVGHCYRCHSVIEPNVSRQWFVKTSVLTKKATASLMNKELEIIPKRFNKVYTDWLENMRDWCISRQLWWGHQIPVWYCSEKKNKKCKDEKGIIVSESVPKKCPYCGGTKLKRDPDVLDTWFSSSLWPFSTLGWPEKTEDYERFYPTSLLETGYDIIFFWVARMTMMGIELTGKSPFSTVYLHGLIRDGKGKKMSKSLGNVIEPIETVTEYGADSLRMTYFTGTSPGNDLSLLKSKIVGSRNFNNKLWNIARYIKSDSRNIEYDKLDLNNDNDKWIVSRIQTLIKNASNNLEKYRFSNASEEIISYVWDEFADWYLELSKSEKNEQVLYYCFETILKLLHPFIPFITEVLWNEMGYQKKYNELLIESTWPESNNKLNNKKAEKKTLLLIDIIKGIRKFKVNQKIEPQIVLDELYIYNPNKEVGDLLGNKENIKKLGRVKNVTEGNKKLETKHNFLVEGILCQLVLGKGAEGNTEKIKELIKKDIIEIENRLKSIQGKLTNNDFIKKAPNQIVDREKKNQKRLKEELKKLTDELKNL